MENDTDRIVFLDWLRAIACFMVMAIHACEGFYLGGEAPNVTAVASRGDMLCVTLTECLCRVAVPLFAMASAYLLFPVRGTTGAFFKRRFSRVFVPFALWAVAYAAYYGEGWRSLARLFFNFPDEGGHLWFVPMLIGLYLAMPLLSPWAEKVTERELKGWLGVWLATTAFPFVRVLWSNLWGEPPFGAVPYIWGEAPWNHFGAFHYVSGFVGYMLLGLWFRRFAPRIETRKAVFAGCGVWLAAAAVMGLPFFFFVKEFPYAAPYQEAVWMETSIEFCSTGVALATFAAFLLARQIEYRGWAYERIVRPVSEASYGMYLMHMFILTPVLSLLAPRLPTGAAIVATAAATYAVSAVAAVAVRRVPLVGKWICG